MGKQGFIPAVDIMEGMYVGLCARRPLGMCEQEQLRMRNGYEITG